MSTSLRPRRSWVRRHLGTVLLVVVGAAVLFLLPAVQQQAAHRDQQAARQDTYTACLSRNRQWAALRAYLQAEAEQEATNKFIDDRLRRQRITRINRLLVELGDVDCRLLLQ